MRAIILAAGRGSRMRSMTESRPKCLVPLGGHTLLSLQLSALKAGGIDSIGIVSGYRGEMLSTFGLHRFHNARWEQTNMVMSLAEAAPWLRTEPCIISYADIFYPPQTIRDLIAAPGGLAISYDAAWLTQWQARFENPLSDAESFKLDDQNRVVDIGRKVTSIDEVEGQYMGLLRFTPAAWNEVEALLAELEPADRDRLDMTSLLSRLIKRGVTINGVPSGPDWGEVDSETDLDYFTKEVAAGRLAIPI